MQVFLTTLPAGLGAQTLLERQALGEDTRLMAGDSKELRIDVVSDLHNGSTYASDVAKTVARVRQSNPDILIIGGDLANDGSRVFGKTIEALRGRWQTAVIAGNHDLWSERKAGKPGGFTSQQLWETELPRITREAGAIWLESDPLVIQGARLAVAGTIGWYDYSADRTGRTEQKIVEGKGHYTVDADNIDWPWTDREFAAQRRASLVSQLEQLSKYPDVDQILVVSHVPPFMELQPPQMKEGEYFTRSAAYYFVPSLGAEILKFPKVTHVVAGHTHAGIQATIQRPGFNPVEARVVDDGEDNEIVHYSL